MIKIKKWGLLLMISALFLFSAACGGGTNEANTGKTETPKTNEKASYSFKLAHLAPPSHMWHLAAEKFKEELETLSEGRMTLQIYPAGQLGNEADMVQQIESGSVDFGFITAAYLSSRSEAFSAWFVPYAFKDLHDANEARSSDVAKKILATLDEQGIKGLDYFFAGQRVMLFKDKEIRKPKDIQGMKLRVTPSPPMQDWYKSLGASPESISLPDVYQAVQTGVIDGMDMDLDATITNKYHEVTKYSAVTNHMVWPAVAIVNKEKYDGMSEEDQKIVIEAINRAAEFSFTTRASQEEEFKKTLSDAGMEVYGIDEALFADYIKQFDDTYGAKDPLIQEFINTFR
jgi:tripartite ATP-independent transporter DctP family solute receptor